MTRLCFGQCLDFVHEVEFRTPFGLEAISRFFGGFAKPYLRARSGKRALGESWFYLCSPVPASA